MHLPARTTPDDELRSPAPQRREGLVTGLAVATVALAALAAAVMHPRPEGRPDGLRLGATVAGDSVRVLPNRPCQG